MSDDPAVLVIALTAEIERLGTLATVVREQGVEIMDLRAENERLRALLQRRTEALHSIGIGGNGEHDWTLGEVRAVAWDALEIDEPVNCEAELLRAEVERLRAMLFRARDYISGEKTADRPRDAMLERIDNTLERKP